MNNEQKEQNLHGILHSSNEMSAADISISYTEEMFEKAKDMQEECHFFIKTLMKQKSISYDAANMVWIFKKLSQIEIRLQTLEKFRR